ncbi:MAG: TetR/AcrR family transcriptional regulator [Xanthobacteraceae bacterium]
MQIAHQPESCTRRRIVNVAIRLFRELGYMKTTVADIARAASMSRANVYRFFSSGQEIEEAVLTDLFEQVLAAATHAARDGGSPLQRLEAALRTISELHENRRAHDSKLHELMAAAVRGSWPITLSYADRIGRLVRSIIAAGQTSGELRQGSPVALACCVLQALDAYLSPSRSSVIAVAPTFDEMIKFCVGGLLAPTMSEAADNPDPARAQLVKASA